MYGMFPNGLDRRTGRIHTVLTMDEMMRHLRRARWCAAAPIPLRTLYPMIYDISERTLEVKFYLKDGDLDPNTGKPALVFSKPFIFKLKEKKSLK